VSKVKMAVYLEVGGLVSRLDVTSWSWLIVL